MQDAIECINRDREVTLADAVRVERAEAAGSRSGKIHPTGVSACFKAAAELNGWRSDDEKQRSGF